jgi:hypothetical protein
VPLYNDFVKTLANRVASSLDTIEVGHNFEYGAEYEIVLCETLRSALPDRFGIARGYAISAEGESAGDDILVFARERFPTLALRSRDDFARKEFVPIEAAYCYVEAKHTIHVSGTGPQSLQYACEQVSRVKGLCDKRERVLPGQIGPYSNIGNGLAVNLPPDFPQILNPSFGVVFARNVRANANSARITTSTQIEELVTGLQIQVQNPPDLIVLGDSLVIVPSLQDEDGNKQYRSPFYIEGRSTYSLQVVDGNAFGIGFASILAALDWIELGVLPWHRLIVDALGIPQ